MTQTTTADLARGLRIQQQEETLAMYGACKIRTNKCEVSFGTIDGVEVLVSSTSPILHRIDLESTEGSIYGYDGRPQDLEDFAPLHTWTRFTDYVLFTRAHWTSQGGNYLRVIVSDVQLEPVA
jgi:hypothetical protein